MKEAFNVSFVGNWATIADVTLMGPDRIIDVTEEFLVMDWMVIKCSVFNQVGTGLKEKDKLP